MKRKGGLEEDGGRQKYERRGRMEGSVGWKERRTRRRLKRKERESKRMQDGLRERKGRVCRTEG
jgi:hypothetical protein